METLLPYQNTGSRAGSQSQKYSVSDKLKSHYLREHEECIKYLSPCQRWCEPNPSYQNKGNNE
eukprot:1134003-Pelagomonas_calceolata.AAC.1